MLSVVSDTCLTPKRRCQAAVPDTKESMSRPAALITEDGETEGVVSDTEAAMPVARRATIATNVMSNIEKSAIHSTIPTMKNIKRTKASRPKLPSLPSNDSSDDLTLEEPSKEDEEYAEHVMKLMEEWNASHPSSHAEIDYAKEEAAQIVEWEEHPEVYERWLRANEPSKLWKELRAIKCKFMGLPYSDLDYE